MVFGEAFIVRKVRTFGRHFGARGASQVPTSIDPAEVKSSR